MKKIILLAFFFVAFLAIPLAALALQTEGDATYDPAVVDLILAGVATLTVVGITQMIKALLKASGVLAYVISAVVSAAATAIFLLRTGAFTVPAFVGYTLFVFLAANGIYKAKN
jgi:hypothetical protein